MPTYGYRCEKCLAVFEVQASISEYERGLDVNCPDCGSHKVRRTIGAVNIVGSSRNSDGSPARGCCNPGSGSSCCR